MFDDLISARQPSDQKRIRGSEGGVEHYLTEGAVMAAFAMHLLRTVPGLKHVAIHPDGQHAAAFDFPGWFKKQGFAMIEPVGKTLYGGKYRSALNGQTVLVQPKSGLADVVAEIDGTTFSAECKGGAINSTHAGQQSRLRKGLCETVGLSLSSSVKEGKRQFAVVPRTQSTERLAQRMLDRAKVAGIEIALVDGRGNVFEVTSSQPAPA
jgi:hypothetical protein